MGVSWGGRRVNDALFFLGGGKGGRSMCFCGGVFGKEGVF